MVARLMSRNTFLPATRPVYVPDRLFGRGPSLGRGVNTHVVGTPVALPLPP